jgi:signal transduction histidine kinase
MLIGRSRLSLQIAFSLFAVFGVGFLTLVLVGQNAIRLVDDEALARQERLASGALTAAIEALPAQQRSATVWDDAVRFTRQGDTVWMNDNLGSWMQEYFGHDENYVLNAANEPVFAAVDGEVRPPEAFDPRAAQIAPLIADLRAQMAQATEGLENPYEELTEVGIVSARLLGDRVSIVGVVPIVSDTGATPVAPGTEYLHVALRHLDPGFAASIGERVELADTAFFTKGPMRRMGAVPVTTPSGAALSWLVWTPLQPGTALFRNLLPTLLGVGLASVVLLGWIVRRLLRVSGQLQRSEAQALLDLAALRQAREAAEVADRAKVNFLSVVSHELRTPLTVILGYARLGKNLRDLPPARTLEDRLHRQPLNARLLEESVEQLLRSSVTGMEKIERSGEHLLFLVNQLLDYAKMDTGRLELEPEICDVQEVLEPVVEQMKVLTDQKGLALTTRIGSAMMLADVLRTRQIVINLLGNAIKFTDHGEISVVVEEVRDGIRIEVGDTGSGIAAHELDKIFEAFHQADLSMARNASGTGLGLSVARQLAILEGGRIDVRSEVGVGSTFTLTLPKAPQPAIGQAA